MAFNLAPELTVESWLNVNQPTSLEKLRGRVVVLYAFQMLCPGCVEIGLPQAKRVNETFKSDQVAVIGLHTVFEHHEAMTPVALKAFLREYGIFFPVAIDKPDQSGIPVTMRRYAMQGTPTIALIDKNGYLRRQTFGEVSDLVLGAEIMGLIRE